SHLERRRDPVVPLAARSRLHRRSRLVDHEELGRRRERGVKRSPLALNLAIGVLVMVATLALILRFTSHASTDGTGAATPPEPVQASYSTLVNAISSGKVQTLTVDQRTGKATATYKSGALAEVVLPDDDAGLLRQVAEKGGEVTVKRSDPNGGGGWLLATILTPLVVFALIFFVLWLVQRRSRKAGGGMLGGGLPDMSLRRSTAVTVVPPRRFSDVAGCDGGAEELAELVQFFKDPTSFAHVGARMPSGVMLYGEPGTGKTLLARALAGEAGIPFYAASGSDFVEKFVGVGAARMRELFAKARSHPEGAVVFIDEIDAIGRARSAVDGNSEREHTLNQILVELDGFSTTDHVVCIAATNRLDILDPALLRPGRFGRHISVPLPSAS